MASRYPFILVLMFQVSVFAEEHLSWPTPDWQVADAPETIGMSSSSLKDYISWLSSKANGEPFGTIVVRNSKIACEYYGSGATRSSAWDIGSIRKPVGSILLGMVIDDGLLSLEDVVYDVWPEIFLETDQDKDKKIRVKHLFSSCSGWKRSEPAGVKWVYNNAAFTASGMVIARVCHIPNDQIAPLVKTRIADRIGASSWKCYHSNRAFDRSFSNPGHKLTIDSNLRDLARFGYLWLRQGEWNGQQIVPKQYVQKATRNQVADLKGHYGYCWFTNDGKVLLPNAPEDAYYHVGNGQEGRRTVLMIIPSLELIAAVGTHTSKYNITDQYTSVPVKHVNEWIGKIMESVTEAGHRKPKEEIIRDKQ